VTGLVLAMNSVERTMWPIALNRKIYSAMMPVWSLALLIETAKALWRRSSAVADFSPREDDTGTAQSGKEARQALEWLLCLANGSVKVA
jgi:hypothetical protein